MLLVTRSKPPSAASEAFPGASGSVEPTAPAKESPPPPPPRRRRRGSGLAAVRLELWRIADEVRAKTLDVKCANALTYTLSTLAGVIESERKLGDIEERIADIEQRVAGGIAVPREGRRA
jgi:hypothetical protein